MRVVAPISRGAIVFVAAVVDDPRRLARPQIGVDERGAVARAEWADLVALAAASHARRQRRQGYIVLVVNGLVRWPSRA